MEFEKFYGRIRKAGDSFCVTIPSNYMGYGGYRDGDTIEVMIKKVE